MTRKEVNDAMLIGITILAAIALLIFYGALR